ncbi:hypothetical protein B0O99DRAFT_645173 [Bisporella sp. PMI_857]|nr:hypothetical protein B0O99DRAFT_645173 [Bisporella sp. PMI_857]
MHTALFVLIYIRHVATRQIVIVSSIIDDFILFVRNRIYWPRDQLDDLRSITTIEYRFIRSVTCCSILWVCELL